MIKMILDWLTGGVLDRILDTVDKRVSDETRREEIKTELAIEVGRQQVQALATSATFKWWHPQNLIGYMVASYIFKIVVFDTVLQWGVTPDPGEHVTWIMMAVVGFYFVNRGLVEVASQIAARRR